MTESTEKPVSREDAAATIAKARWQLALHYHCSTSGKPLDFTGPFSAIRPFYESALPEISVTLPPESGKTEFAIVDALATIMLGYKVLLVVPTRDQANDLCTGSHRAPGRIIPVLEQSPTYQRFIQTTFSAFQFNSSCGGRLLVAPSTSESRFVSYANDKLIVIRAQHCDPEGLSRAKSTLAGSRFRFITTCSS